MTRFTEISEYLEVSPEGPWIVGGAVRKHYFDLPQDADYDITCSNQAQLDYTINIADEEWILEEESEYARSYTWDDSKIQILKKMYPSIEETFKAFDFTCCCFAWDGDRIHTGDNSIEDARSQVLSLVSEDIYGKDAIMSIVHGLHYKSQYGFECPDELIEKLARLGLHNSEGEKAAYLKRENYRAMYGGARRSGRSVASRFFEELAGHINQDAADQLARDTEEQVLARATIQVPTGNNTGTVTAVAPIAPEITEVDETTLERVERIRREARERRTMAEQASHVLRRRWNGNN